MFGDCVLIKGQITTYSQPDKDRKKRDLANSVAGFVSGIGQADNGAYF